MPKSLIEQLGSWRSKAKQADEYFNPPVEVDPAVVAAKEKAIVEARRKTGKAKSSRSQKRKEEFLAREREKAQMVAKMESQRQWEQLPQAEQQQQLISGVQRIGSVWARALGFPMR